MNFKLIHPFLIAVFPVLFLYNQNVFELEAADAILPLILNLAFTLILLLLLNLIIKDRIKAALVVTAFILVFFSYGHLLNLAIYLGLSISDSYNLLVFPIMTIAFGIILFQIIKTKRNLRKFSYLLNILIGGLVSFQLVSIGYATLANPETESTESMSISADSIPSRLPDIYYIILDGYGRHDVLNSMYDYDNGKFISNLRSRGFYVADSSHSNYCTTQHSVTSALNFDYIHRLINVDPAQFNPKPLRKRFANNRLFGFLKKLGYRTVLFASGMPFTELKSSDFYFSPGITLSEFDNLLLNFTPVPFFMESGKNQFDLHRDRINYILDKLGDLNEIDGPKMVFAHILSPHPPFVFDQNGNNVRRNWPFSYADGDHYEIQGGTTAEYISGYRNQATYISGRIIETLDRILENSEENPPIIIVQGDHGPGSQLFWETASKTNMHERFSILNAYYLPGINNEILNSSMTPVNSFRIILDLYFGTKLKMLPSLFFYTKISRPFQFIDVTDHLHQTELEIAEGKNALHPVHGN